MRKKKKIAELMEKLSEISKINESLLLENAEQKARLKTAEDELAKAEVEKIAEEAETDLTAVTDEDSFDIENSEVDEDQAEEITEEDETASDAVDFDGDTNEALQEETSVNKLVQIIKSSDMDPAIQEKLLLTLEDKSEDNEEIETVENEPIVNEIENLKSRSDRLEAEILEIKKLILQKNTEREKIAEPEDTSTGEVNPVITKNIGKLIVDAQMGAKRIIDQAKNEAEEYLQKARRDADLIVSQAEFRSRNIYKGFCDAEAEIDQLIMKMEDLSEQIQNAKRALKN